MLNIDDDKMKVDERTKVMKETKYTKFDKTKAVLDEMILAKKKSVTTATTPELNKIFKDLYDKRKANRNQS